MKNNNYLYKTTVVITTTMLLLLSFFTLPAVSSQDWVIDGNKIYYDDEYVYLSATPHTIGSSGWVTFELESKRYSGDIDIIWGFNIIQAKPTRAQLWTNYTHQRMIRGQHTQYHNTSFYDVNTSTWINTTEPHIVSVDILVNETYYDWLDISGSFTKVIHEFKDMDTWYLRKDVSIQEDIRYKLRAWIDVPFTGLETSTGKYWWAIKPSSETLQQATANKHLYYLDPWWDTTWGCRVPIYINDAVVATPLNDYPILVKINATISASCNSGKSIRFTLDDNDTLLNFEIENYTNFDTSGTNYIWVNVTYIKHDEKTLIWLYYNNAAAADGQNVFNTWDGWFKGVWHCNDSSNLWDSTVNRHDGTAIETPTNAFGLANGVSHLDSVTADHFNLGNVNNLGEGTFTLEAWTNTDSYDVEYQLIMNKKWGGVSTWYWYIADNNDVFGARFGFGDADDQWANVYLKTRVILDLDDGLWDYLIAQRHDASHFSAGCMGVTGKWFDGSVTANIENADNADDLAFGSHVGGGRSLDASMDEFRMSSVIRNDSWLNMTFEVIHNHTDVISFGPINCSFAVSYEITWSFNTPINGTEVCPCCFPINFTISHSGAYLMNITIWSNWTGTWELVNSDLRNLKNGTYGVCINKFTILDKIYYFNATINDGTDENKTGIYYVQTFSNVSQCSPTSNATSYAWVIGFAVFSIFAILAFVNKERKRR